MAIPDVEIFGGSLFTIYFLIYSPDGTNVYGSRATAFQDSGSV